MNYLETVSGGDTFTYKDDMYVSTSDFKKNGSRLCVNLKDGSMRWLDPSVLITKNPIYSMDNNSDIIPVKPEEKNEKNI